VKRIKERDVKNPTSNSLVVGQGARLELKKRGGVSPVVTYALAKGSAAKKSGREIQKQKRASGVTGRPKKKGFNARSTVNRRSEVFHGTKKKKKKKKQLRGTRGNGGDANQEAQEETRPQGSQAEGRGEGKTVGGAAAEAKVQRRTKLIRYKGQKREGGGGGPGGEELPKKKKKKKKKKKA